VEGVQLSKFKRLCFIVTIIDRTQKYVVPAEKMKMHFPQSLYDYLTDLIQVHIKKKSRSERPQPKRKGKRSDG
jgi:hypothetical protein